MMNTAVLTAMCEHCNNWWTRANLRRDFMEEMTAEGIEPSDTAKWIPEGVSVAFMNLSLEIADFMKDESNKKTSISGEKWENTGYTKVLEWTSWQKAFERDLATYRRPRFI